MAFHVEDLIGLWSLRASSVGGKLKGDGVATALALASLGGAFMSNNKQDV